MRITTKSLQSAIATIIAIAEKKTTIPYINCLRLATKGGRLSVSANNFDAMGEVRLDCEGELTPFWVNAHALAVAADTTSDELELTVSPNCTPEERKRQEKLNEELSKSTGGVSPSYGMPVGKLTVKGKGTSNLSILEDTADAPKPPTEAKWVPLGANAKDLVDAIKSVAWCGVADKADKPLAEAVWVKTDAQRLKAACADGAQMAFFSRASICGAAEFMFQFKYADLLCAAIGESGAMFVGEKHVRAQSDALTVTVKQMEGKYWSIEKLLEMKSDEIGRIETGLLVTALSTCKSLSNGLEPFCDVQLSFSAQGLHVGYAGKVNQFETTLEGKYAERDIRLGAERAIEVLKNLPDVAKVRATGNAMILESEDLTAAIAMLAAPKAK